MVGISPTHGFVFSQNMRIQHTLVFSLCVSICAILKMFEFSYHLPYFTHICIDANCWIFSSLTRSCAAYLWSFDGVFDIFFYICILEFKSTYAYILISGRQ